MTKNVKKGANAKNPDAMQEVNFGGARMSLRRIKNHRLIYFTSHSLQGCQFLHFRVAVANTLAAGALLPILCKTATLAAFCPAPDECKFNIQCRVHMWVSAAKC